jgi:hypothetical protein
MAKKTAKTKKAYRVPLRAVGAFVLMLKKEKLLKNFLNEADQAGAALTMEQGTVDFMRKYLDDNKLHPKARKALGIKPKEAKPKMMAAAGVQQDDGCPCVAT